MRKKIFTAAFAAVILLCSCTVQARPSSTAGISQDDGVETIFKQFRNEKNVTYIDLPKSLIKMGLKSSNDKTRRTDRRNTDSDIGSSKPEDEGRFLQTVQRSGGKEL